MTSEKKTLIEKWREWLPPKESPEESVPFRIAVFLLVSVGILTASSYATTITDGIAAVALMGVGFLVSWLRRAKNNWHIKTIMAITLLVMLFRYLEELMGNPYDTRLTLATLLINLSVLHSYDIPGRKNMAYATFIGLILMGVSATINRDMLFIVPALLFVLLLWVVWRLDSRSAMMRPVIKLNEIKDNFKIDNKTIAITIAGFAAVAAVIFVSLPHFDNNRMIQQMPVSVKIDFPKDYKKGVQELPQTSGMSAEQAKTKFQEKLSVGEAFYGFSSDMDLNYRGKLSNKIAMRVRSSQAAYWRGMAYDTYTGNKWMMSKPDETVSISNTTLPLVPQPTWDMPKTGIFGKPLIQTFYIEEDMSNLMLMASYPVEIYFPTYQVDEDIYGGYRSPIGMIQGITYTIVSSIPNYDPERLRKANAHIPKPANTGNYLQLPDTMKSKLTGMAAMITASATNDYDRATLIEAYLQLNYRYNLDIPPLPEDTDNIEYFLFTSKEGYCEHFASSMVLLCRSIGLPARVVTGFAPGKRNSFTHYYEVRWSDAHAWVEVYFDRYGWVPFEPTVNWGEPRSAVNRDSGKSIAFSWIAKIAPKNVNISFDNSPLVEFNQAVNSKINSLNNLLISRIIIVIEALAAIAVTGVLLYYLYRYIADSLVRYKLSRSYPNISETGRDGMLRLYRIHKKLGISTKSGLQPPEIVQIRVENEANIGYNKKLYLLNELKKIKQAIYET